MLNHAGHLHYAPKVLPNSPHRQRYSALPDIRQSIFVKTPHAAMLSVLSFRNPAFASDLLRYTQQLAPTASEQRSRN